MTVESLLQDLVGRGVGLAANGDQLDIDAPDDVLTDELLATLRENKAELLAALRPVSTDRPRIGSAARPIVVRGTSMPSTACLWATCGGSMTAYGNRYLCSDCATWFELLPPEELVYVGDLADELNVGDDSEVQWVM